MSFFLSLTPFSTLANREDPDQAALVRSQIRVYSFCLWEYDIFDPTLMDLKSNFFVLCTNMKFIYIIIHSGWSLA